jgi:hypothetical protein
MGLGLDEFVGRQLKQPVFQIWEAFQQLNQARPVEPA